MIILMLYQGYRSRIPLLEGATTSAVNIPVTSIPLSDFFSSNTGLTARNADMPGTLRWLRCRPSSTSMPETGDQLNADDVQVSKEG